MEKYIAIWLDNDHAEVMIFQDDKIDSIRIDSHIIDTKLKVLPSSRSIPGEPSTNQEEDYYAALQQYFEEIAGHLVGAEGIYIFGPAKTKVGLYKMLFAHREFKEALWGIDRADGMSIAEIQTKARKFFENEGMLVQPVLRS